MAITVTHTKVSTIPDGDDSSLIRPSDWNSTHTLTGLGTMAEQNANAVAITGGTISGVAVTGYIPTTEKAQPLGVATLDAGGKVPQSQIPLMGDLNYQGTWNATTNTPTLTSSVGTKGYYYVVDVAGTTNLNGITDWQIGDWAIFNGSVWQKVDNTDAVTSVNGFTGTVVLTTTNIAEGTNLYYTDAKARASNSAGTGISYDNATGVITNSAPDQVVALTGAGTTVITGTYPNFTITSNDAYVGTVTSVSGTAPVSVATGTTTPVISLDASYGDTQNPYASKTANYVLASPNGSAGAPTFRALTSADIPSLSGTYIPYTGASSAINLNNQTVVNIDHLGLGTATVPTILMRAVGDNNSSSRIAMRGYSSNANSSSMRVTKFRGTVAAPQAPQSGDSLGKFELAGYGTTSSDGYPQASYEGLATEAWGAVARGTKVVFKVTPNTTTTQVIALTIDQNSAATFASSVTATSFSGSGASLTNVVNSLTASTGISVSGSTGAVTVTNTAPDQTVALTSGIGISVTGTYPNFTVTNTAPSSGGTVTSVGGTGTVNGLTLTGTVTTSGNLTLGGTLNLSSPPVIGNTTPAAITGTTITATQYVGVSGGTF
jgi:hypothetical protein